MPEDHSTPPSPPSLRQLPRNVWAVSLTSFLMDISSEMVINILPLFLANVLGVRTNVIGLIEGIAEATSSILKLFSGWLSDRLGERKWIAVAGYGLSALAKPFFYFAGSWELVAGVRWADRVGKGLRSSPRDALLALAVAQPPGDAAVVVHEDEDDAAKHLRGNTHIAGRDAASIQYKGGGRQAGGDGTRPTAHSPPTPHTHHKKGHRHLPKSSPACPPGTPGRRTGW